MKAYIKIIIVSLMTLSFLNSAHAQVNEQAVVDSTYLGKDIFKMLSEENVSVSQSDAIRDALKEKVENGSINCIPGYRIRIFFSNAQDARQASAAAAERFMEKFGTHSVYHNYSNANFKVTVGNFRTKSEALELLNAIRQDFPSAFIVKENITVN